MIYRFLDERQLILMDSLVTNVPSFTSDRYSVIHFIDLIILFLFLVNIGVCNDEAIVPNLTNVYSGYEVSVIAE